ncbi:ethanolaminephosphotransferase [Strigomonas culicis]|uniref:Ethanolaminephosphotransferase n=1 Tax=Strigomonas culicis TaxID=28005 RepID=S9VV59_9TRYP|nr:ethanolaminephosphotransferase [Strigomonas culicis]|eukprot:EPY31071.1 ethanolaminephosphotransferase [Strigomonas culicis]
MTIAPNCITFIGFVVGMSSFFINLYFFLFQNAEYPAWAWFYAAFSLFFYQTFDALDGKQARRTGTGSPLGELYDHGCDAFLTPFVQANMALATNLDPALTFAYVFFTSIGLFTAIWEQYTTGTLDLGYISGPVEGILLSCGMFCVSGFKSTAFWVQPLFAQPYTLPLPFAVDGHDTLTVSTCRDVILLFFFVALFFTVLANLSHAITKPTVHASSWVAYRAALPTCVITILHVVVYRMYPHVQAQYPFVFEFSYGLLISQTVTRLTVSRLCIMPYRAFFFHYVLMLVVHLLAVANKVLSVMDSDTADQVLGKSFFALALLGAFCFLCLVLSVFRQLADYLGINIMSIKKKKQN